MKKRVLCLLLALMMLVSLAGCGKRNVSRRPDSSGLSKTSVKLQKPPKRQRLFLPTKSRSSTVNEQTQNLSTAETETAPEPAKGTAIETDQVQLSHTMNGNKTSYAKELKSYKKAISKLKGKSFVLTMNTDVDLRANERGRREYAKENVNLTANIKKNGSKRMEMSGNCSVTAAGTKTAFNFYQYKDTAYVEYTSPRHATALLEQIPTESMLNYQFEITEEDVRSAQTAEDGIVMVVDGSVLNLHEILEDLLRSGFDSVTCDAMEIQLWTDKKGRPSELDLFYTVEFTLGDATATADYEETLTFTNYGKAKINKPTELTERKKEPGHGKTPEVEPQEAPDIYLDEKLEPEPEVPDHDLVTMAASSEAEAYETILDEYRNACSVSIEEFRENAETEYPHVNPKAMEEYHTSFHQPPEAEEAGEIYDELYKLRYAYYDIDGNGIDELIISGSLQEIYLFDLYAFDGQNAVKLFPNVGMPIEDEEGTTSVRVNKDGVIVKQYPGDSDYYRIAEDGYSLEHISGMVHEDDSLQLDWEALMEDSDRVPVEADNESPVAEAYRDKLLELAGEEAYYTLSDLTGDGIEELIVSITDMDGDGGTYHFYTFNGDYLEEIGTLDRLGSILYRDEDGGLIFCQLSEDAGQINRISYDGAEIVTNCLSEYSSEDEDDNDLAGNLFDEWERDNASYLSELLEPWPVTDAGLLEQTFGVRIEETEWPSDKPELSEYLWSVEEFHQLVGGEPSDEVGDHESWYIQEGIQYGNYIDSSRIDEIVMESSEYQLFGVAVGEDVEQARERLEQDGWAQEDEYEDSFVCVKDSEWLQLSAVGEVVTSISYWNEAAME